MVRLTSGRLALLLVMGLALVTGCSPDRGASDPNDNQNTNDNSNTNDNGNANTNDNGNTNDNDIVLPDCGDQTVTTMPGAGFVRLDASYDGEATPADADLAKVLFPMALCPFDATESPLGDSMILYETNAAGTVIAELVLSEIEGQKFYVSTAPAADTAFSIELGCLYVDYELPDDPDQPDPDDDLLDPDEPVVSGPCPANQLALGRNGQITDADTTEDYICIDFTYVESCLDCYEEGGVWYTVTSTEIQATALGTLDNVATDEWGTLCGETASPVSITEGDTVNVVIASTITFSSSQSPEDMGYTELGADFPGS